MKKIMCGFCHFFLPSETNNYRAKLIHIPQLAGYIAFLFAFAMVYKIAAAVLEPGHVLGTATNITVEELVKEVNRERTKKGLPPLHYSSKLEKAAYDKAQNMFNQRYWAHYGPDGSTPWDFILASGYHYQYAGENLAKDFLFSDGVVDAWMASPTHRDNILRPQYTDMGIAVVNGTLQEEPTTLVVQIFGAPLATNAQPTARVLAASQATPQRETWGILKKFTFNSSLWFLALLLIVLTLDLFVAYRLRLMRITGKHAAHGIFLAILIAAFLTVAKGSIL